MCFTGTHTHRHRDWVYLALDRGGSDILVTEGSGMWQGVRGVEGGQGVADGEGPCCVRGWG